MAPYDKDAKVVAEQVEKVEPVKKPEAEKTQEHRELEMAIGRPLLADQLESAKEYLMMRQCDCTAGRASLMYAGSLRPPMPPEAPRPKY